MGVRGGREVGLRVNFLQWCGGTPGRGCRGGTCRCTGGGVGRKGREGCVAGGEAGGGGMCRPHSIPAYAAPPPHAPTPSCLPTPPPYRGRAAPPFNATPTRPLPLTGDTAEAGGQAGRDDTQSDPPRSSEGVPPMAEGGRPAGGTAEAGGQAVKGGAPLTALPAQKQDTETVGTAAAGGAADGYGPPSCADDGERRSTGGAAEGGPPSCSDGRGLAAADGASGGVVGLGGSDGKHLAFDSGNSFKGTEQSASDGDCNGEPSPKRRRLPPGFLGEMGREGSGSDVAAERAPSLPPDPSVALDLDSVAALDLEPSLDQPADRQPSPAAPVPVVRANLPDQLTQTAVQPPSAPKGCRAHKSSGTPSSSGPLLAAKSTTLLMSAEAGENTRAEMEAEVGAEVGADVEAEVEVETDTGAAEAAAEANGEAEVEVEVLAGGTGLEAESGAEAKAEAEAAEPVQPLLRADDAAVENVAELRPPSDASVAEVTEAVGEALALMAGRSEAAPVDQEEASTLLLAGHGESSAQIAGDGFGGTGRQRSCFQPTGGQYEGSIASESLQQRGQPSY